MTGTAADFWKQFPTTASFLEPCQLEGRVVSYEAAKGAEGEYPRLLLLKRDGAKTIVNATQTRLISELVEACPGKGDIIRIEYRGAAARAPRGLSPTKDFVVTVLERYGAPKPPAKVTS